ncbi:MAG: hypothetical protein F4X98_18605 [Gammaproteobacteria bacterium]|nr:hypothetical protein [Gammaproteobacteria bacterium]
MNGRWFRMLCVVPAFVAGSAVAAELSLSVESEAIHANMPFTLALSAKGFEEEPTPEPPTLAIDGCEVTYLGVSPSVSSRIEIINNRRSEWRDVTFVYRWRVLAPSAGRYTVPPLRVEQGGVAANVPGASFEAPEVPETSDMIVRLRLPERPVWVGETFEVGVDWLLGRDVRNYQFAVPLFDLDGAEVTPGEGAAGARIVPFYAGTRQIGLPLARSTVNDSGRQYTRFSFPARVTLNRPGTVELDPVRVVAQLQAGSGRDRWGFSRPRYELHRAEGDRARLTVRPLPVANRPATFVNAIGGGFSIDVQASRTVVSVGEPVELALMLRGDGPLTGVSLPPLVGPGGLPAAHFSVPEGSIPGEIDADTNSKRFAVTVRVKSAEVREIPAIAFSYFDPGAGEYRTVTSRPVALSVGAGEVIGVDDVVAAPTRPVAGRDKDSADPEGSGAAIATLVGADMSLSDSERTLAAPWGDVDLNYVLPVLYGVPVAVVLLLVWLARSDDRRAHGRAVRQALRSLEQSLATRDPARQAAPDIVAAMRRLANVSGSDPGEAARLLEQLETRAFDPAASDETVSGETADELRRIARRWASGKPRGTVQPPWAAASVLGVAILLAPAGLGATDGTVGEVERARELYRSALEEGDRLRRVRQFGAAERAFRSLADANWDAPELQVDWGNAALGSQDAGRAVLAYRRALDTDPGNERARANLAWLRDRQPIWLPRPPSADAFDSLLFWRQRFTVTQLHLIGGVAFAIGVLALAPWRRRPRGLRGMSVPFLIAWAIVTGSALATGHSANEGVVLLDGATLRSADSAGASPTFANPLPAGTEVTVVESRDAWVRVALEDGSRGWLAASAVETVVP